MTQGEASHLPTQRKPRCVGHPAAGSVYPRPNRDAAPCVEV